MKIFLIVFYSFFIELIFAQNYITHDSSFWETGKLFHQFSGGELEIFDAEMNVDSNVFFVGTYKTESKDTNLNVLILKFNPEGIYNDSFGFKVYDVNGYKDIPRALAFQSNKKIVVCGSHFNGSNYDVLILKLNENGSIDSTFGKNGFVIYDQGFDENSYSILIDKQDNIYVGATLQNRDSSNLLLLKFDGNGKRLANFDCCQSLINLNKLNFALPVKMAFTNDDKIIVVGENNNELSKQKEFFAFKFDSLGTIDNTFGILGLFTSYALPYLKVNQVTDIEVLKNGNYFLAGGASEHVNGLPSYIKGYMIGILIDKTGKLIEIKSYNLSYSESKPCCYIDYATCSTLLPNDEIIMGGKIGNNYTSADFGVIPFNKIIGGITSVINVTKSLMIDIFYINNGKLLTVGYDNFQWNGNKCGILMVRYNLPSILTPLVEIQDDNLFLYPNPFVDFIVMPNSFSSNLKKITLFDVLGKNININAKYTEKEIIISPTGHLPTGAYFVSFEFDKHTIVKQVIKIN